MSPRLRGLITLCRHSGLSVLLVGAAAALVVAPVSRSGCPTAARALAADTAAPSSSRAPVQDPSEVAADASAVAQAQSDLDALSDDQSKAATLESAAQAAEQAAEEADGNDGWLQDYELRSAQSSVDMDRDEVSSAEQDLASAQNDDYSWYPELQQSDIDRAQDALAQARATLAEDQKTLSDLREKSTSAAKLKTRATTARAKADAANAALADRLTEAQQALSSAEQRQRDHVNVYRARLGTWTHEDRVARRELSARNAVVHDCRREAVGTTAAAGALVLGGAGIQLLPLFGRLWPARWRRQPRR